MFTLTLVTLSIFLFSILVPTESFLIHSTITHRKHRCPTCYVNMKRAPLESEPLELCDENALIVLDELKKELGTIFGYDKASRDVGITGQIELVEIDGPTISVSLSGRFWHATDTVMMRVESFIKNRIPEVLEVNLNMEKSSIQDDNRLNSENSKEKKKLF